MHLASKSKSSKSCKTDVFLQTGIFRRGTQVAPFLWVLMHKSFCLRSPVAHFLFFRFSPSPPPKENHRFRTNVQHGERAGHERKRRIDSSHRVYGVSENKEKGKVLNSTPYEEKLTALCKAVLSGGETIEIKVV